MTRPRPGRPSPRRWWRGRPSFGCRFGSIRLEGAGLDGSFSPTEIAAADLVYLRSPTSEAVFTIRPLAPTGLEVVSRPLSGDTYRRGERIEVAVSFGSRVLVDVSQGRRRSR